MKETYGVALPNMRVHDLVGKLIVIEGTDGVGRSTQITLLKDWLEERGPRRARYRAFAIGPGREGY